MRNLSRYARCYATNPKNSIQKSSSPPTLSRKYPELSHLTPLSPGAVTHVSIKRTEPASASAMVFNTPTPGGILNPDFKVLTGYNRYGQCPSAHTELIRAKLIPYEFLSHVEPGLLPPFPLSASPSTSYGTFGPEGDKIRYRSKMNKANVIYASFLIIASKAKVHDHAVIRRKTARRIREAIRLIIIRGARASDDGNSVVFASDDCGEEKWLVKGWTYAFFPNLEAYRAPWPVLLTTLRDVLLDLKRKGSFLSKPNPWGTKKRRNAENPAPIPWKKPPPSLQQANNSGNGKGANSSQPSNPDAANSGAAMQDSARAPPLGDVLLASTPSSPRVQNRRVQWAPPPLAESPSTLERAFASTKTSDLSQSAAPEITDQADFSVGEVLGLSTSANSVVTASTSSRQAPPQRQSPEGHPLPPHESILTNRKRHPKQFKPPSTRSYSTKSGRREAIKHKRRDMRAEVILGTHDSTHYRFDISTLPDEDASFATDPLLSLQVREFENLEVDDIYSTAAYGDLRLSGQDDACTSDDPYDAADAEGWVVAGDQLPEGDNDIAHLLDPFNTPRFIPPNMPHHSGRGYERNLRDTWREESPEVVKAKFDKAAVERRKHRRPLRERWNQFDMDWLQGLRRKEEKRLENMYGWTLDQNRNGRNAVKPWWAPNVGDLGWDSRAGIANEESDPTQIHAQDVYSSPSSRARDVQPKWSDRGDGSR